MHAEGKEASPPTPSIPWLLQALLSFFLPQPPAPWAAQILRSTIQSVPCVFDFRILSATAEPSVPDALLKIYFSQTKHSNALCVVTTKKQKKKYFKCFFGFSSRHEIAEPVNNHWQARSVNKCDNESINQSLHQQDSAHVGHPNQKPSCHHSINNTTLSHRVIHARATPSCRAYKYYKMNTTHDDKRTRPLTPVQAVRYGRWVAARVPDYGWSQSHPTLRHPSGPS